MNTVRITAAVLAGWLLASAAQAEIIGFTAKLDGASEVPTHDVHARGSAKGELDTATGVFTYAVEHDGLTGPIVAAHFHGPANVGQNAPPVVMIAPAPGKLTGSAHLTAAQAADLRAGKWYVNLHTALNPGGEIRGQVLEEKPLPTSAEAPAGPAVAAAAAPGSPVVPSPMTPMSGDRTQIEARVAAHRCDQAFELASRTLSAQEAEQIKARCEKPDAAAK